MFPTLAGPPGCVAGSGSPDPLAAVERAQDLLAGFLHRVFACFGRQEEQLALPLDPAPQAQLGLTVTGSHIHVVDAQKECSTLIMDDPTILHPLDHIP
jgi:hypothetical protein